MLHRQKYTVVRETIYSSQNQSYLLSGTLKKNLPTPGLETDPVATCLDYEIKSSIPGMMKERQARNSWALGFCGAEPLCQLGLGGKKHVSILF